MKTQLPDVDNPEFKSHERTIALTVVTNAHYINPIKPSPKFLQKILIWPQVKVIWIIFIVAFILGACSKDECPVVGNNRTKLFHVKGCPNYQRMLEKNEAYDNRVCFKDQREALANGYLKAGNCSR